MLSAVVRRISAGPAATFLFALGLLPILHVMGRIIGIRAFRAEIVLRSAKSASASVGAPFLFNDLNVAGLGPTITASFESKADPRVDT